jgi:hypothetical protein
VVPLARDGGVVVDSADHPVGLDVLSFLE